MRGEPSVVRHAHCILFRRRTYAPWRAMRKLAGAFEMAGFRFTREYSVKLPLVSAGMAMVTGPELVAEVSNAGGLGILGTGPMPPELLRRLIANTRSLTALPFGVNLIVEDTGIGPASTFEHVKACIDERVSPVVFFWNSPPGTWFHALRDAGIKVWITASSVADARRAHEEGYDAVVVQSNEAGGHVRASESALSLWPAVRDAVGDMLMVAAGGIADGRTAAAAFMLGADAICMGTRLVASAESLAHPEYKAAILRAQPGETSVTRIFGPEWPDAPMRVIRNLALRDAENGIVESGPVGKTKLFGMDYVMPRHSAILPTRESSGSLEHMCLAAGTSVGRISEIEPVRVLVTRVVADAIRIISEFG
jgi:NAD(P)H-dependent flavin oxidoreductase YrpB (nitropropane dioxygenase family)